jgi:hypothetical protein
MTIGVEVTGGYDEFGESAAVRTLLVQTGKSNVFAAIFLSTPIPNAINAEYVATVSKQAKCEGFLHTNCTDQRLVGSSD